MTIEYKCGHVAYNVGIPTMSVKAHMNECENAECVKDCAASLKRFGG